MKSGGASGDSYHLSKARPLRGKTKGAMSCVSLSVGLRTRIQACEQHWTRNSREADLPLLILTEVVGSPQLPPPLLASLQQYRQRLRAHLGVAARPILGG